MLATQSNNSSSAYQKSDKQIITDKELAKIAGVSHNTIWQVGVIENEGSEEVQAQARKGQISINKAFNKTRPKEPKKPQGPEGEKNHRH